MQGFVSFITFTKIKIQCVLYFKDPNQLKVIEVESKFIKKNNGQVVNILNTLNE